MPLLETVLDLRKRGYSDSAIIDAMKERGISPREITNALSQASVKSAVDSAPEALEARGTQGISSESMQPSIMEQAQEAQMPMQQAQPQMQQQFQAQIPQAEAPEYIYPTPQAYSYPEQYAPQQAQSGYETETMSELAEQIVAEKLSDTNKKLSSLSEFRKIAEAKIDDAEQRLRKIESMIESLQIAILSKIAGYSNSIEDIKTEMQGMQGAFSKALNPLMDKARSQPGGFRQRQETAKDEEISETSRQEKAKPSRKGGDDFEAYLR